MGTSKSIFTVLNLKDNFSKNLKGTARNVSNFGSQLKHMGNNVGRISNPIKGLAGKIAAAFGTYKLIEFGKKSVELASDLTEVQNVVDKTYGKNAKAIDKWSKTTMKSYGLSELQAKTYSSRLAAMMKSEGFKGKQLVTMSKNMTGLSGDFASFFNDKPAESFDKIRAAIAGATVPLHAYGINLGAANMQEYLQSKGIHATWKDLSQKMKTLYRYNYLMEHSKDSQGDFQKTSKTFANQQRILKTQLDQTGATLAKNLIPVLTHGLWILNDIVPKVVPIFNKIKSEATKLWTKVDGTKKLKAIINTGKNVFSWLKQTVTLMITPVKNLMMAFGNLGKKIIASFNIKGKGKSLENAINKIRSLTIRMMNVLTKIINFTAKHIKAIENIVIIAAGAWGTYKGVLLATMAIQKGQIIVQEAQNVAIAISAIRNGAAAEAMEVMQGVTKGATAAQWLLNAALDANPISIVIVAVGALVTAGILLWKNWKTVKKVLLSVWDGLKSGFASVKNFIIGGINAVIKGLNKFTSFKLPSWLGGGKVGLNIPTIKTSKTSKHANGSAYMPSGSITTINEHGGEIMQMPSGTRIIPNDLSKNMVKNNTRNPYVININISGDVIGDDEHVNKLANKIAEKFNTAFKNV